MQRPIPPLQPGDTVAIVAPARKIMPDEIAAAVQVLQQWGLQVVVGESVGAAHHQFAGNDTLRLRDLQVRLDDPGIKAILCARGGHGTTRLLDQLDFTGFQQSPKWVAGFSDITALHCHLHQLGYESLHAEMPLHFGQEGYEAAVESLRKALFGEPLSYQVPPHSLNQPGAAKGLLVGGNLSLLLAVTGTRSDLDTKGKILFMEDIDESLYRLDRMLVHLNRSGKLSGLAGLVVGHFSDIKEDQSPFGQDAYEIIHSYAAGYGYPICYGFPTGHEPANMALVCGRAARLEVKEEGVWVAYTESLPQ